MVDADREKKLEMRKAGMSYAAIAKQYNVSRQSVHQLLKYENHERRPYRMAEPLVVKVPVVKYEYDERWV